MKFKTFIVISLVFIATYASAQDFVEYKGEGQIELTDGTTKEGVIYYSLSFPGKVKLILDGKDKKYGTKEVVRFTIGDKAFESIETKDAVSLSGNNFYYALCLTPKDSKIKVYKQEHQSMTAVDGNAPITTYYYVKVPSIDGIKSIGDVKFTMSKNVAKYLKDCPALEKKVAKKEKGYAYKMLSSDLIKLSFWLTIAEEYNTFLDFRIGSL